MSDPMDMVIGAAEPASRDSAAAEKRRKAARAAEDAGDRMGAIALYRKAAGADAGDTDSIFRLAFLLDLTGEEDEAMSLYERLIELQPAPVNALMNLAVLYEDRADFARAEKCLRQVLDTNPNHLRARLFMKDVAASREMVIDDDGDRDVAKRNALLDTPVTDFDLSVRARNCLKKMNIRSLGDLLRVSEAELMGYKNFGEATLVEIKQMLSGKGLRLGQRLDDQRRQSRRDLFESLRGSGNEAALARPVTEIEFSVRVRKALQLLGIHTLGDLASRTEAELMGVKNFGATSLYEVKARLTEHGLALRNLDE
ncbi:MAG: tetratricopeptide repeat protein [Phycisphaerales bacterium]|nr:tetratricopeptide repeat protein [Phycisphaerales bacterium]